MSDGVHVEHLPDGSVRIIATAKGGSVKLRVTKAYARRLAAELMGNLDGDTLSHGQAQDFARAIIDRLKRGGHG